MYRHFIWDFDGTLFDTYPVMAKAFRDTLHEDGIVEDIDMITALMKISIAHTFQYYQEQYGMKQEFRDRFRKRRMDDEMKYNAPFPGAEEICATIANSNRHNYLYTHRSSSAVEFLKKYGLYEYFTDFILKEDGFERKPSPQALNFLVQKHNIKKEEAIMIGDRDIDILAGKNAGMATCLFQKAESDAIEYADVKISEIIQLNRIL